MPQTITTSQVLPYYSQRVTLEGSTYNIILKWNERDSVWYMSLLTDENVPLMSGVKVVSDFPLNRREASSDGPPGLFVAYDTSEEGIDAGFEELGERVLLFYYTQEEVEGAILG